MSCPGGAQPGVSAANHPTITTTTGDDGCCAVADSVAHPEPTRTASWHILLCCSGSVASLKVPELAGRLLRGPADGGPPRAVHVRVLSTERARHFFAPSELPAGVQHLADADEWAAWHARGDAVQHIEQRAWADALLLAPTSANTLAKLAHGLADNLVTCVARAWPLTAGRPALLAPAMNTSMWQHPATAPQLRRLRRWGYVLVPPVTKTLMCGETGVGAMANVGDICEATFALLRRADAGRLAGGATTAEAEDGHNAVGEGVESDGDLGTDGDESDCDGAGKMRHSGRPSSTMNA